MADVAYVNGQWGPLAEARVPVLDRGFLFADGVYEVVPVYAGRGFRVPEHLRRLAQSLSELRIRNPHSEEEWTALLEKLVHENLRPEPGRGSGGDLLAYLQVTRGAPAKRSHPFPENMAPTVVGLCQPLPTPSRAARDNGVSALTAPDIRWGRCDIKSIALLPNILAAQSARESDCNEAILHRDGRVTEGASSNVFIAIGGRVLTPPQGPDILPGVTRDLVIELLTESGTKVSEENFSIGVLRKADEIWLTSATREVLAVTRLDAQPVGSGKPGPLWAQAWQQFQAFKARSAA
jgi:D-alanine transaminase